jgi:hypothetical protein
MWGNTPSNSRLSDVSWGKNLYALYSSFFIHRQVRYTFLAFALLLPVISTMCLTRSGRH